MQLLYAGKPGTEGLRPHQIREPTDRPEKTDGGVTGEEPGGRKNWGHRRSLDGLVYSSLANSYKTTYSSVFLSLSSSSSLRSKSSPGLNCTPLVAVLLKRLTELDRAGQSWTPEGGAEHQQLQELLSSPRSGEAPRLTVTVTWSGGCALSERSEHVWRMWENSAALRFANVRVAREIAMHLLHLTSYCKTRLSWRPQRLCSAHGPSMGFESVQLYSALATSNVLATSSDALCY